MACIYKDELFLLENIDQGADCWGYSEPDVWISESDRSLRICDQFVRGHFHIAKDCIALDLEIHDNKVDEGFPVALDSGGGGCAIEEAYCGEKFEEEISLDSPVADLLRRLCHEERNLHHVWVRFLA